MVDALEVAEAKSPFSQRKTDQPRPAASRGRDGSTKIAAGMWLTALAGIAFGVVDVLVDWIHGDVQVSVDEVVEHFTAQIADAIQDLLQPRGVGVVITSEHTCMTMRGVNTPGSQLTTSTLLGDVRDDPRTRAEFLAYVRRT